MNQETRMEMLVNEAQYAVDNTHARLLENVKHLADSMTRLAANLEREGTGARVNSLGEVQGSALNIDRLCALLTAAQESRALIARATQAAARDAR